MLAFACILRLDAARLVSTPSPVQGLGSGLPFDRFPRVWAVLHLGFPARALNFRLSPLRIPFRHACFACAYIKHLLEYKADYTLHILLIKTRFFTLFGLFLATNVNR